ncbi:unnamed protein product [Closterium sp. Naga37s-1]|nr:unnamed protein product [Closterium sp. Naga37s-1]
MASRTLLLVCVTFLAVTSAFAQRGPPRGGPPGGQGPPGGRRGGGPGGRGGPGGGPGGDPRGPPLNLTAVGNLTADVGAQLKNCSADPTFVDGRFHLTVFKISSLCLPHPPSRPVRPRRNSTGNYNLLVDALLVGNDVAAGPPDSIAIVQGAVCDSAASAAAVLSLPFAASDWLQRAGWWLLHAEARLDAFLENADATTVDALLALLPNASLPRSNGGGRNGGGSSGGAGGAGGARNGQGSRRLGLDVGRVGRMLMRAMARSPAKQGGQQQGGQQQGGQQQGGNGVNSTVSGYAVLAGNSASSVIWGGQLLGVKAPSAAAAA